MKKSFILLVAFAAMVFASCSKDDDGDPTKTKDGKALVTKIIQIYSGGGVSDEYNFTYDEKGNLTKVLYKYKSNLGGRTEEKTYVREGNKITETTTYGDYITHKWYTLDANGRVLKIEDADNKIVIFTYNKNGERIKREQGDYVITYNWSNGNMVQSDYTTLEYYTEYPNINIELGQLEHDGFDYAEDHFGNKNLLKAENGGRVEYEYEFDGNKVTSVKKYKKKNNEGRELRYTCHFYYE